MAMDHVLRLQRANRVVMVQRTSELGIEGETALVYLDGALVVTLLTTSSLVGPRPGAQRCVTDPGVPSR
jgi:hypothetical protein